MQQFVVPQFIDVESKIIGPITVRQFITFLFTGFIIFVEFRLFQFWIAAVLGVLTFGIGGMFAFAKINGRAFHFFLLSLLQTFQRPRLQVWDKTTVFERTKKEKQVKREILPSKRPLTASRLAEISLIVDTGGAYQEGLDEIQHK